MLFSCNDDNYINNTAWLLPVSFRLCFKNSDFLEVLAVHDDLCVAILFTNATQASFSCLIFFNKLKSKNFLF